MAKKNLMKYFGGLRLSLLLSSLFSSLFAVLLLHISSIVTHQKTGTLMVVVVFVTTMIGVMWSSFYERKNNTKKYPRMMTDDDKISSSMIITIFFGIVILLSLVKYNYSHYQSILLIVFIFTRIFLPYTRKWYGASMLVSALINALPILLMFNINDVSAWNCLALFLFIFFNSLAWEIFHDIENIEENRGYKKTVVESCLTEKEVIRLAEMFIFFGIAACLIPASNITVSVSKSISFIGIFVCLEVFFYFNRIEKYSSIKDIQISFLNLGVGLIIFAFAIMPFFSR